MGSKSEIIKIQKPEKTYGSSILRVATQFGYVSGEEKIADLAEALVQMPELQAVGVVDKEKNTLGLVSRANLYSLLGKPFGREILAKRRVSDIVEIVPSFELHTSLFQVAVDLEEYIQKSQISFFLLKDLNQRFRGIFSSRDILAYLSRMTQDDIEMAARLQERMVRPREEWSGATWQAEALSRTAQGVGGDFYYYQKISEDRHFFAIGDVSGKGVAASILTSLLWGTLKTYDFRHGLIRLVLELNSALIQTFQLEKYLTGIFMIWDDNKKSLKMADMGHGHIGVVRKGRIHRFKLPHLNLPLGIEPNLDPKLYRIHLKKGDSLVAYTDGVIEQENGQGDEFGDARLEGLLAKYSGKMTNFPQKLWDSLVGFRQTTPQHDDVTWIQMTVGGSTAEEFVSEEKEHSSQKA